MSELQAYNAQRARQGAPPLAPKSGPKRQRALSVSDETWANLRKLAADKGYTTYNAEGNVTAFLEALAHGLWALYPELKDQ